MRFLLSLLFVLPVAQGISQAANDTYTLTEVQKADLPCRMQDVSFWGISTDDAEPTLYYSFTHKGAGIQVVRGAMSSGGKDPVDVEALGKVLLDPATGAPGTSTLTWVAPAMTGSNINIFTDPVSGAQAISSEPMARNGSIISDQKFNGLIDKTEESNFYALPAYKSAVADSDEPEFIESYANTTITVGLSGDIQTITTSTHTLRPEDKRGKSLLGDPNYKMQASFAKGDAKQVFKDTDMSYKLLSAGNIPQISDPSTGNVVLLGGLKYKKDDSKKGSHYREFFLLGADAEGNMTGKEQLMTDVPLELVDVYYAEGKTIAPGVRQGSKAVFLAKGAGEKDDPNVDPSLLYAFVVDINTAKVISQNQANLPEGESVPIGLNINAAGNVVLLYYTASNGQITPVTLTSEGLSVGEPLLSGPLDPVVNLPTDDLEITNISSFSLADGRDVTLKLLGNFTYDQFNRETSRTDRALLLFYSNPDGSTKAKVLMKAAPGISPITRKGDRILLSSDIGLVEWDLAAGESKLIQTEMELPSWKMFVFSERFSTLYGLLPTKASTQVQLLTYRFE